MGGMAGVVVGSGGIGMGTPSAVIGMGSAVTGGSVVLSHAA
jgi:hypothetical protein